MKISIIHIILASCCAMYAHGQSAQDTTSVISDSLIVVGKIVLVGNSHTRGFVITREMTLQPGVPISQALLEYDRERIYSLRLFNQVQLRAVPSLPGVADIIVDVNERWYIFPFPVFGIKDRDWAKVFYGLGLLHSNFRGRNEKLYGTLIFGYDPSVALAYRNPFLDEEGSYLLDVRLAYSKVRNKSLQAQQGLNNFDERHVSSSLSIGRRFGIEHTVWLSAGYEVVDIADMPPVRTLSPDGRDQFPTVGIGYSFDTRDLVDYATVGFFIRGSMTKFGFPSHHVDHVRYAFDLRKYTPLIFPLVFTSRFFTDLVAGGATPGYNRTFFGYGERIRGHFRDVFEGESILGFSAELHYPLLSPQYFRVGFLPAEFGTWKFGIGAAIFGDAGTVWFRDAPVAVDRFLRGYGFGLHFLLPYSAVLRTEYAWNELRQGEFILDVGTSF